MTRFFGASGEQAAGALFDGESLRALPPDLRSRLQKALTAARHDEIVTLVEAIRAEHPRLADGLLHMVNLFDYAGIQALLRR
jgi:hypothetical protein